MKDKQNQFKNKTSYWEEVKNTSIAFHATRNPAEITFYMFFFINNSIFGVSIRLLIKFAFPR